MNLNLIKLSGFGLIALIIAIYVFAGLTHVNPGETTILIKNIGSNKGMQPEPLLTGTHWVDPWTYDVVTYDTRLRQMEEVTESAGTGDGQPITIVGSLQLGLDPKHVPQLHQELGQDFYSRVIHPALISIIKNKAPSQNSDEAYTLKGREAIEKSINDELTGRYGKDGIIVVFNLKDLTFANKQYVGILEAKALATQKIQVETRLAAAAVQEAAKVSNTAEGQKQARIRAAEANREEQRLKGEGSRLGKEEEAKGNLALATAEARGIELRRQALSGAGGSELVSIEWAKQMGPNIKVYAFPTGAPGTSSIMDLNGIMQGALKGEK